MFECFEDPFLYLSMQYFRRVLKNVDNKQGRKPAICDVCLSELEGGNGQKLDKNR